MITAFRRYLETWVVRGFFLIMVVAFVVWGVGDVVRVIGTGATWVAKAGGETIEGPQFQAEFQRDMAQASRSLPAGQEPSAEMRREVGDAALQRLITQAALGQEIRRLRIVTPDASVRAQILGMPAFHGPDGKFSRQSFDAVLQSNGLNEARFLDMMRSELSQEQLLQTVGAGGAAPATELNALYASEFEKRSADMAEIPITAAPAPPAPTEAQLKRWYDNHPFDYSTPEYRRIKAIVLSPQTLASEINITDADLQAAYDQHKAQYITPAKRSAEVISVGDEAKAKALAAKWSGGADWAAMQAAAQQDGGSAIELNDAREQEFPDPALAKAVFAAAADSVVGPVKGALSWHVLKVTKAEAGTEKSFDQVKDQLRNEVLAEKATDLMYDRANKVDNLLGNGTPFDQLPSGLGLAGITGTLDKQGDDKEGKPAPIPGPPALKSALVAAAFQTPKGQLPQLTEVRTPSTGGSAYYALTVEDIIPPGEKPFDAVKDKVASDWTDDQQRHEAETQAAKMLTAIKGGQSIADAATVAGVQVRRTPLVTRSEPAEGMPQELQRVLFGLKKGEPTMVETPEAFVVAVPAEIVEPDPKSDPAGYARLQTAIDQSVGQDLSATFTDALRQRANPRVNKANYDSVVQPQ